MKIAPFRVTPKTRSNACPSRASCAIAAAPDQPRHVDLSGLGGFVCDLSGPPAAVGVLDGGSLAGKDSSSSSSSLSSGFDCGLLGGDFRGSFIPASPWRCSVLWKHQTIWAGNTVGARSCLASDLQPRRVFDSARESSFSIT